MHPDHQADVRAALIDALVAQGGGKVGLAGDERITVAVDFVQNAASLGARTFTARTRAELVRALDDAQRERTSCCIYVPLEEPSRLPGSSWWDVPVAEVSQQPEAQRARADYQRALQKRRFYY